MTTKKTRCFIALPLPKACRLAINKLNQTLQHTYPQSFIHWQRADNLHITLRYIGSIDASTVTLIESKLKNLVTGCKPFTLALQQAVLFPNTHKPIVIAIKTDMPLALLELANACEQLVQDCGLPAENRPFNSHLSIARIKKRQWPRDVNFQADFSSQFTVDRLALYESMTHPDGAVYKVIRKLIW